MGPPHTSPVERSRSNDASRKEARDVTMVFALGLLFAWLVGAAVLVALWLAR